MIPLRLRLKNFLGYRDSQELSLEGIHLACLAGDNGAGKSALLDAMTWALWGQARGRTMDDLVHLGQSEMEVELEFAVGTNAEGQQRPSSGSGQRYRVLRQHSRGYPSHPPHTLLELGTASPSGVWQPLTGNSLRETQQKIKDIVRLDYDTFINSAFLLQGRADEFTIKNPAKRKELLAQILGLSFYEELERRAKEQRRERETQVRNLDSEIEQMGKELAGKPTYEAELQQVQEALSALEPQLRSQEALLNSLRHKRGELEAKGEELKRVSVDLAQAQREMEAGENRQRELQRLIAGYEQLFSERQAIEDGYSQLQQAKKEAELWNDKLLAFSSFQLQQSRLEPAIREARAALETELALLQRQVAELEREAQALPQLQQALSQAQAQLAELLDRQQLLKQKRQTAQEMRAQIGGWKSDQAQMETELASLRERLNLLAQGDARCPLCETELGVEGRQRLEAKYHQEIKVKTEAVKAHRANVEKGEREFLALAQEADKAEAQLDRDRAAAHRWIAMVEKDLNQAGEAQGHLPREKAKLAGVDERLARGEFAQGEQTELGQLKAQIVALGYDSGRHQQIREGLRGLEPFEGRKRQLDEAEIRIQAERQALSQATEALRQVQGRWHDLERQKQVLAQELAAVPELDNQLHQAEASQRGLLAQERGLRDRLAKAQNELERCRTLEQTKVEKAAERDEAAREEGIFKELAEAFSKKGVPALLIEAALPELEAEANRLLSRMTDNQLHIKLETQREHRDGKGEPVETLDIRISDELGTRDYEMYSGGEAFRINLALRIALSKLLAHRAGAPLPILVIDEGFGTQDSAGREKLVEAITSIQEDFDMILAITHIEELKELFPVRIEVTKTSQGSTFRVVE